MMMLALQLLLSLAVAADVAPKESSIPVRVHSDKTEAAYHPLLAGKQLTFDTPGPGKWRVEIRQRVAGAAQRAEGSVVVLGNGTHQIMTIELKATADAGAKVDDVRGGVVTKIERASITVPAAGRYIVVQAPKTSRDVLVRLYDNAKPAAPVAAAPVKPVSSTPFSGPTKPQNNATAQPAAKARRPAREPELGLGTGISMGLGIPARGSKAVGYLGADVRYPVYKKLVSASGSFGWYRIGVDESFTIADPHLGHTTVHAQWTTSVFPIIARGLVHSPVSVGPVTPVGGLGLGLFIAHRTEGDYSTTQVGVGPEILAGGEYNLGHLGDVGANLSWSEARMYMGHQGTDGLPVRETVANTRLNLCWFHTF